MGQRNTDYTITCLTKKRKIITHPTLLQRKQGKLTRVSRLVGKPRNVSWIDVSTGISLQDYLLQADICVDYGMGVIFNGHCGTCLPRIAAETSWVRCVGHCGSWQLLVPDGIVETDLHQTDH